MNTSAKKPAPPTPCSVSAAQESEETSGHSAAAATTPYSEDQDLTIHLPDGSTGLVSIDPSKPMMDLLIKICGQLRLSPADHTLQVFMGDSSWPVNYKANRTLSSLGVSTVKLVSKKLEREKLRPSTQQPFEITQRLIVNLPNNQKYVMRVKPEILLSELFDLATAYKGLDPQRYKLCHPSNPDLILDMDSSLNVYGISEICLVNVNSNKVGVPASSSERQNFESVVHETTLPMASIARNQSSVQGSQSGSVTSVPGNYPTKSNRHTMQKSSSHPGSESSGFMPATSFEKKKGFLSFLKRKKSGKFSLGGSMQNLHQIDSGSTATISKQKLHTPMTSESQLHKNSLPTSSTLTLTPSSQQMHISAAGPQLQLQIPAASKKRPAPQPPGVLLPLTTDGGTGRLVRPPPRLPAGVSHPLTARSGLEDSVRLTPQVPDVIQCEGTGDIATQLTNGIGHSPSSSQSSGFEEMSPSPLEDSRKPSLHVEGSLPKSDAVTSDMKGGGECWSSTTVNSGSTVHFDFGPAQQAGKTKRRAPPPPVVQLSRTPVVQSEAASSIKPTPPSSLSSDNYGPPSILLDAKTGTPDVNSVSTHHLSRDDSIRQENQDATNECTGKNRILQSVTSDGSSDSSAVSGTVEHAVGTETCCHLSDGKDAQESGGNATLLMKSELMCAETIDDEDADALAAEAEDCFCEPDISYDGEINFDSVDFTFVTPEIPRPTRPNENQNNGIATGSGDVVLGKNSTVASKCKLQRSEVASLPAAISDKPMTSQHHGKSVNDLRMEDTCSAEELNSRADRVCNYQLPDCILESKTADVLNSVESGKEVSKIDFKPTVLENYSSHVDSVDFSGTDGKSLIERKISDEVSRTVHLNNVSGIGCSSESTELKCQARKAEVVDCNGPAVRAVALETQSEMTIMTANMFPDKTMESDYCCSPTDANGSAIKISQEAGETAWEPHTIIIDKSQASPMYTAPNVPEVNQIGSERKPSDPWTTEGSESQSFMTVATGERTAQTASQLSIETREKLSDDSFLLDRSLCSRFYPSMPSPNICGTANERTLSCANMVEEKQVPISKESPQIKSDFVVPISRNSDSKQECSRRPLYHLVRHSPPAATDDFMGDSDNCRNTADSKELKPECNKSEQQTPKAAEKAEKHSTNTSFAADLQRHLSRWQQQHPKSTNALPGKSASVNSDSDKSPSSPTKNPSCFNSVSASDTKIAKEVKDSKSCPDLVSGPNTGSLSATGGSLEITTGSSARSSVASGSSSSSAANKGFSKADVVFTMEQLLNAKSSLKRTAWSEHSPSEVSQNRVFYGSPNLQSSVKENRTGSVTPPSQESVRATTKMPPSSVALDGGVCSAGNHVPVPPALPAFVGNHMEKKTGSSGRTTEGSRNKILTSKSQPEVNVRDDLLTAIRNAGGKPVKSKVASG